MSNLEYRAGCFCGEVTLRVVGEPIFQGFCHCESCRVWLGAPMNAATLWPSEHVSVLHGHGLIRTYRKLKRSHRKHCSSCGGAVMNDHPEEGMTDVFASLIRDFEFRPSMHVHYGERIVTATDDLPKFIDLPEEFGGTGRLFQGQNE